MSNPYKERASQLKSTKRTLCQINTQRAHYNLCSLHQCLFSPLFLYPLLEKNQKQQKNPHLPPALLTSFQPSLDYTETQMPLCSALLSEMCLQPSQLLSRPPGSRNSDLPFSIIEKQCLLEDYKDFECWDLVIL